MSTRTRRSRSGLRLDRGVELGVETLAAVLEAVEERLVVDAGAEVGDLLDRHAARGSAIISHGALHRVAEPDDLPLRRALIDELADHRHRVRVVEEPRVRADLGHVVADAEHHRGGAQRADDAADAERVADRLAHAVAGRDLEVAHGRRVAADLDAVDDVVGAVERRRRSRDARHPRRCAPSASATRCASTSAVSRRSGSMSWSDDLARRRARGTRGCRRAGCG